MIKLDQLLAGGSLESEFSRESQVRYYSRLAPRSFKAGRGSRLQDVDGNEYVDFFSAAGALNYGHNHPVLKAAVADALARDSVVAPLDLFTPERAAFLQKLEKVILEPRGWDYKVQFPGPTGANAVEAALKLARKATGRIGVAAFTNAFHGCSLGALSVTGNRDKRSSSISNLMGVTRLAFDGYAGGGYQEFELLDRMFNDASSGVEPPAAIILEVVQGEGGLNVASRTWLSKLRFICDKYEIVLIADEIQCGCGRTGRFFSFDDSDFRPDIICLSKSLSGIGLPLSILFLRSDLDVWKPGEHTGTFRAGNLAVAAATRALDFWTDADFVQVVQSNSMTIAERLTEFEDAFGRERVRSVGKGLMCGLRLTDPEVASKASALAFRKGLLIETCGPSGNILKMFPAINILEEDLVLGLNIIGSVLHELL